MNRIARNQRKEDPIKSYKNNSMSDSAIASKPNRNRFNLFTWLAGVFFIFSLLYVSSYVALLQLPPYQGMDMKSQLTADYRPWPFLEFQPVDPAIIEEIRQDRGLPEEVVIPNGFSSTPTEARLFPSPTRDAATSMPWPTMNNLPTSPTDFPATFTPVSIPLTTVAPPQYTSTPQPATAASSTKSKKPAKTPKPHKTPKTK